MLDKGVMFTRQPKTEKYGTVAVFADFYGNLGDLVKFTDNNIKSQYPFYVST